MSRIAVMMATDRIDGKMSSHFGKAPWVMVVDGPEGAPEFVKNESANGSGAAGVLIGSGCTDAILVDIGDGALRRLQAAKIGAWAVPGPVTGREALRLFAAGELSRVPVAATAKERGEHHGCCCGGHGAQGSTHCCA